jgi:hypothetical protein
MPRGAAPRILAVLPMTRVLTAAPTTGVLVIPWRQRPCFHGRGRVPGALCALIKKKMALTLSKAQGE